MEDKYSKLLSEIGLTNSEIKLYFAMLRLGSSSKGALIKESRIAASKIYEVADKLLDKGLCSVVIKNGVKNFMPAPPARIKNFLKVKGDEILREEKKLEKIMPQLENLYNRVQQEVRVELFIGWKGLETAFGTILNAVKREDDAFIIGAGEGENRQQLELFYTKHGRIAFQKGLKIKAIFNEDSKDYVEKIERNLGKQYNKRFLFKHTPTEILISDNFTCIIIRRIEPLVILIRDKETAISFRSYFEELWKIARR